MKKNYIEPTAKTHIVVTPKIMAGSPGTGGPNQQGGANGGAAKDAFVDFLDCEDDTSSDDK